MDTKGIVATVKRAIRSPYAWPGGYPAYTVLSDGALLCAKCARDNFRQIAHDTRYEWRTGWNAAGVDVLWEGEEYCGHCSVRLESAYGDA